MADENNREPFRLDPSQEEKPFFKESTTYVKDQSVFCKVHHVAMLLSEAVDTGEEVSWVWIEESGNAKKEREYRKKVGDELFPNSKFDEILDLPSGCRPMGGVRPAYLYCPECDDARWRWEKKRDEAHIEHVQRLLAERGQGDKELSLKIVGDYAAKLAATERFREFKLFFEHFKDIMKWGEEERKKIVKIMSKEMERYKIMLADGIDPIKEDKPASAGDDKSF